MQAIFETLFDVVYLVGVISLGAVMIRRSRGQEDPYRLFGIMAVVLGCGDAFHLVPRAVALCTTGLEDYAFALGIGKLVTSITMTAFYCLLYQVYERVYHQSDRRVAALIYLLAAVRVALCLFSQNGWTLAQPSLAWGVARNVPFALMGLIILMLFARRAGQPPRAFRFMALAIGLSFACYIPVVLFSGAAPAVGMLMIPKTCAYVWIVYMGFAAQRAASTR